MTGKTGLRRATAGKRTIGNLLTTAFLPVGITMYVWGGGWNEEDDGAGEETKRIGLSPRWKDFADKQNKDYDFKKTRFQVHDGLDCSGYVGWVIYNTFEKYSGGKGYVMPASCMAWEFAGMGWGFYTPADQVRDWRAGDIMSSKGHVWISLGMCEDGSVLLLHASPPGVILCGTDAAAEACGTSGEGIKIRHSLPAEEFCHAKCKSQAVLLAEQYMSRYFPEWLAKYPNCSRDIAYLQKSARMRWCPNVLTDPEGLTGMSAKAVLKWIFEE